MLHGLPPESLNPSVRSSVKRTKQTKIQQQQKTETKFPLNAEIESNHGIGSAPQAQNKFHTLTKSKPKNRAKSIDSLATETFPKWAPENRVIINNKLFFFVLIRFGKCFFFCSPIFALFDVAWTKAKKKMLDWERRAKRTNEKKSKLMSNRLYLPAPMKRMRWDSVPSVNCFLESIRRHTLTCIFACGVCVCICDLTSLVIIICWPQHTQQRTVNKQIVFYFHSPPSLRFFCFRFRHWTQMMNTRAASNAFGCGIFRIPFIAFRCCVKELLPIIYRHSHEKFIVFFGLK